VRAACRKQLDYEGETSWVINPDEGLTLFTVSGRQAVMVNNGTLCGVGKGWKGITYSNRGSSPLAIYVRSGNAWRRALFTDAIGDFFLSTIDNTVNTDGTVEFKALVLNVFLGSEECPIEVRKVHWSKVVNWKLPCAVVVKWNGTKFTYKPL
jgi:hypothetical protein